MTIKLSDLGGAGGGGTALGEITRLYNGFPDDYQRDGQKFIRSGFAVGSGWDASLEPFIYSAGFWSAVTSGFGSTTISSVATDQAGVWVAVGFSGVMTRSTDNGLNWSAVTSGFGSGIIRSVATDQAGVWVAVGDNGVMTRSANDGASWSAVTSGFILRIWSIATDQAGVWVAVGENGVMTRSTNDGASWSAVTSGFGITRIYSVATDQAGVWVAVDTSGNMTRADGLTFGIDTGNDVDYVRYL